MDSPLFDRINANEFEVILLSITQKELEGAPQRVKNLVIELNPDNIQLVKSPDEAYGLAQAYLDEGIVGPTSSADCLHIATATVFMANILVSWNFKHIVIVDRIKGYKLINLRDSYHQLDIRSIRELLKYEDKD